MARHWVLFGVIGIVLFYAGTLIGALAPEAIADDLCISTGVLALISVLISLFGYWSTQDHVGEPQDHPGFPPLPGGGLTVLFALGALLTPAAAFARDVGVSESLSRGTYSSMEGALWIIGAALLMVVVSLPIGAVLLLMQEDHPTLTIRLGLQPEHREPEQTEC